MRNTFSSTRKVQATELQNLGNSKQTMLTTPALILLETYLIRVEQVRLAAARALTTYQQETRISRFIQIFCILNVFMTQSIKMKIAIKTWAISIVVFLEEDHTLQSEFYQACLSLIRWQAHLWINLSTELFHRRSKASLDSKAVPSLEVNLLRISISRWTHFLMLIKMTILRRMLNK